MDGKHATGILLPSRRRGQGQGKFRPTSCIQRQHVAVAETCGSAARACRSTSLMGRRRWSLYSEIPVELWVLMVVERGDGEVFVVWFGGRCVSWLEVCSRGGGLDAQGEAG